jgi:16S rRNA (cytidine1402-2'-O)-methyltransferase
MSDGPAGTLHVVATPLGNLEDITLRAVRVLREVSLIACEDTRRTAVLLRAHGITTAATSYFEHNERWKGERILAALRAGRDVALVSDAGTPGVSDPGFRLVRDARAAGIPVVPVPGPSAAVAALSVSGLPTDRFLFVGFLPAKSAARRKALEDLAAGARDAGLLRVAGSRWWRRSRTWRRSWAPARRSSAGKPPNCTKSTFVAH